MQIKECEIKGLYLIENFEFHDDRGGFVKSFSDELFRSSGINFVAKEIYYSLSRRNVIRGMHFQLPPKEHAKLIYVTSGSIVDVILDLRTNSSTFGKCNSFTLSAGKNSLFIPEGCAHGFKSLEDNSCVVYNQTSCYSREHDAGILWNSFGFAWDVKDPILSERDKGFTSFTKFKSPF
jgi:dTDP-4-dehydrorhamnose 3,5-epimerase